MAALPLPLRAPPPAAAASHISRPLHGGAGAMNVHPLCWRWRGPSSAPAVKLQLQWQARTRTRDSFRCHCENEKRADDGLHKPDSEPENHDDPDKAAGTLQKQNHHPLVQELLDYLQAMGVRVPPDMFLKEKERISDYTMKLSRSSDTRSLDERVVAKIVCSRAREGLDLASTVMDVARDAPGTINFSQHTTDQMVRTYATILYNVADDAYHKKIGTEGTISFLGALRGLGAICHILVQDTMAKLKDGRLKNKITHQIDKHSQEFYKKMNNLEDEVARIKEQKLQQMVTTMLLYGLQHAHLYICQLIDDRKLALDFLTSKEYYNGQDY